MKDVSHQQPSKQEELIWCRLRHEWVVDQPEERVRQALLTKMIESLDYPEAFLAVECSLHQLPHLSLSQETLPKRRVDIVCFGRDIHPNHSLYPLLIIECKAVKLTTHVVNQVMGYNHYVGAYFIGVANQDHVNVGWFDDEKNETVFVNEMPSYTQLLQWIHNE